VDAQVAVFPVNRQLFPRESFRQFLLEHGLDSIAQFILEVLRNAREGSHADIDHIARTKFGAKASGIGSPNVEKSIHFGTGGGALGCAGWVKGKAVSI